jgi:hypothetical protein
MGRYEVGFTATTAEPVDDATVRRVDQVVRGLPGVAMGRRGVEEAEGADGIAGRFVLLAEQGMADAARDASRLAQEALTIAGLSEAELVELSVRLLDDGG